MDGRPPVGLRRVRDELAPIRVITPDLRGFGAAFRAALHLDPSRFTRAVLTPAYPSIGDRALAPQFATVSWYQHFHREPIAAALIDGRSEAVRSYLDYLWIHWSGPATPPPTTAPTSAAI